MHILHEWNHNPNPNPNPYSHSTMFSCCSWIRTSYLLMDECLPFVHPFVNAHLFYLFKKFCFWLRWIFCCCLWSFSSCGEWGLLSRCGAWVSDWLLLFVVGAWALGCGLSSCGLWALGAGSVAVCTGSSCLAALGSSQSRDWTRVPCTGRCGSPTTGPPGKPCLPIVYCCN